MKTKQYLATAVLSMFLITGSGNAFAAPTGAVAQGNISVYQGGRLADKFTGRNPVADEALLVCDGTCMIKASGISLVGTDGARLSIKTDVDAFNLLVDQGRVDFVITDTINKVAFYTPNGQYTVADVMFNSSTNTPVRGYMQVGADGQTEIGVNEGRMVFNTAEGALTVDSNNKILLAMAEVPAGAAAAGAAGAGAGAAGAGAAAAGAGAAAAGIGTGMLIAGGVVVAAVGVGVAAASNDDGDVTPPRFQGGVQLPPSAQQPPAGLPATRPPQRPPVASPNS